jgi:hypothetical protein
MLDILEGDRNGAGTKLTEGDEECIHTDTTTSHSGRSQFGNANMKGIQDRQA